MAKHTARRLEERYGIKYAQLLHDSLINQVRTGQADLVYCQSLRVSVYDGTYVVREKDILNEQMVKPGQLTIRFVYDRKRHTLATVLMPNWIPGDQDLDEDDGLCSL